MEIPAEITLETQQTLERLGINPEYAVAPVAAQRRRPCPWRCPRPRPAPRPRPGDDAARRGHALSHPNDLFPPQPGQPADDADDDGRRWTDPL